jgi:hypothetical protein
VVRRAPLSVVVALSLIATGCCDDEPALPSLPRCEDICPMGPRDSWLCTRNPNDGIERCACPANDETPQPCDGDL